MHSTRLIFCNFVWDTFSGLQKQVFPFFTVLGSLPELHFLQVIHSNSSLASEMLLFWTLNKLDTITETNCMKTYFNCSSTKDCQRRKLHHDKGHENQVATFISQKSLKDFTATSFFILQLLLVILYRTFHRCHLPFWTGRSKENFHDVAMVACSRRFLAR